MERKDCKGVALAIISYLKVFFELNVSVKFSTLFLFIQHRHFLDIFTGIEISLILETVFCAVCAGD